MGGRERSWARAVLSRLPCWLTALGIVLLLGELTGAAALLAAGTTGAPRTSAARRVPHGAGSLSPVAGGGTRTVALTVTGVGMPPDLSPQGTACRPACDPQQPGVGGPVDYTTPAGSVDVDTTLPFTTTVRVSAGGAVTLQAYPWLNAYGVAYQVTCSILLNGRVLSTYTSDGQSNGMNCHATIPSGAPPSGAAAPRKRATTAPRPGIRTVTLRVGGLSPGDTLDYETPAGSARDVHAAALTFTTTLRVYSGGVVTIHAFTSKHDPITCSIAADGRLLLQSSANQQGRDFCQARIP